MGAAGWLLERKLGMPLLDRATRPLALTADGWLYYGLAAARGRISGSRRTRGLGVLHRAVGDVAAAGGVFAPLPESAASCRLLEAAEDPRDIEAFVHLMNVPRK